MTMKTLKPGKYSPVKNLHYSHGAGIIRQMLQFCWSNNKSDIHEKSISPVAWLALLKAKIPKSPFSTRKCLLSSFLGLILSSTLSQPKPGQLSCPRGVIPMESLTVEKNIYFQSQQIKEYIKIIMIATIKIHTIL